MDRLEKMFIIQEDFMRLLQEKRGFPNFPVVPSEKEGQKFIKHVSQECMSELFEAIQHLKNSKAHRATDVRDFDRKAFVEELSDALHYYVEILILSGVTPDEIFTEFVRKNDVNVERIREGY